MHGDIQSGADAAERDFNARADRDRAERRDADPRRDDPQRRDPHISHFHYSARYSEYHSHGDRYDADCSCPACLSHDRAACNLCSDVDPRGGRLRVVRGPDEGV